MSGNWFFLVLNFKFGEQEIFLFLHSWPERSKPADVSVMCGYSQQMAEYPYAIDQIFH